MVSICLFNKIHIQLRMVNGLATTRHVLVIKICPEKYALLEHAAHSESDDAAGLLSCSPKLKPIDINFALQLALILICHLTLGKPL